jgi:hypothetical protein
MAPLRWGLSFAASLKLRSLASFASDHLPVLAELKVPSPVPVKKQRAEEVIAMS